MGEPYTSTRGRTEFASVGEMKLSNTFVLLEKKKRSSSKEKIRETIPQRQNDMTVKTARTETPQGRMREKIRQTDFQTSKREEEILPHQYDMGVCDCRQVP